MLVNISPMFFRIESSFWKSSNILGDSLVDLGLVGGERFDARVEIFITLDLDLSKGFDQDLVAGIHFTDQGLDAVDRRLQRHQPGLGLGHLFLELVQRHR